MTDTKKRDGSDSLDELVRCPNCKKEYDTNFHREWMTECMDSHAHIKCECGATFWIKAIPQNILWKVTPNEKDETREHKLD